MTIPRSVADVLTTHTLFEVECIDRMYLNVYVPGLQYAPGLVAYVHRQLGLPVASTAPLATITDRYSAAVHRFADTQHIPWVDFARGQRKDDVMHEHLKHFTAPEGVVFIGRAQERTPLFRTEKRRDADGNSYPWIVKTTGVVNHYYFYCVDADFGPFFRGVLLVLPLQRQTLHQRPPLGPTSGREGPTRVHRTRQRLRRRRRSGRAAGDLRPAHRSTHRCPAPQVADHPARSVHRRRPGRRLPLRPVGAAGRVLPDPDARRPGSPGGCSSNRSSATTSTSAARTRSRWSSAAG
jgi:hypothetical protein